MKGYIILCRRPDGTLVAYAETSLSMYWSGDQVIVYKQRSTKYSTKQEHFQMLLKHVAKIRKQNVDRFGKDASNIFLTRVGSKRCPVKVDLTRNQPTRKGNKRFMLRP
jgi:hypothetical protein